MKKMEKIYRVIIVLQVLIQLAWFYIPWGFAYSNGADSALLWLGKNAYISDQIIIIISNSVTALYLGAYLGLFFFQGWARHLLLLISLFGGLSIVLYGLSIQSSYESMLGYFMTLGDGFIIALAYFSSLSSKFKGLKSGH